MLTDFPNSITNWFIIYFLYTYDKNFHDICNELLHYFVKFENPKMLLILAASTTNC